MKVREKGKGWVVLVEGGGGVGVEYGIEVY